MGRNEGYTEMDKWRRDGEAEGEILNIYEDEDIEDI